MENPGLALAYQDEDPAVSDTQESASSDELELSRQILRDLLYANDGCVSTKTFRKALVDKGICDADDAIIKLRFAGRDESEIEFYHRKRSFYSPERFREAEESLEREVEKTTAEAIGDLLQTQPDQASTKTYRQDEARLCAYVRDMRRISMRCEKPWEHRSSLF